MKSLTKTTTVVTSAAVLLLSAVFAGASSVSLNTGSLGASANGTSTDGVTLSTNSPLAVAGDMSAVYGGGSTANPINTTVAFHSAVNPVATSPFSIEFWVNPGVDGDTGWAPVYNRVTPGNRSGWTFFQRGSSASATSGGWNLALYNGSGSTVGKQITGGGSSFVVGSWMQVVGVWDGTDLSLYINGVNTGAASSGTGYASSTSATFSVGSYETGSNSAAATSLVDETAFYNTALTPAQILAHYNAASSTTAGVYSNLVKSDGALLYLQNSAVPEPAGASLAALGLLGMMSRRGRKRD